jgi:hypothetical protein
MSLQIQLKKSAVSQKQPFASDLAVGEIALNYNAAGPFLTCKDSAGNVRKLNNVWVAATAPTGPSAGDFWLDTSAATAVLKVYKDSTSTWVNATAVPLATTSIYGTVQLATTADVTNGTAGKIVDAAQLQSRVTSAITSALSASPLFLTSINLSGNATINGNLDVNGTVTTIDSTNILVQDKVIEIGTVPSATDTTANGGGISLRGTTDKTILWVNATGSWTSSENISLASGKTYSINGTSVLNATTLGSGVTSSSLTRVGTIASGVWQGTRVALAYLDTAVITTASSGVVVNSMIANGTITDAKLATISTAGKVSNSATTATNANTANAIVARDASGNFSAGTITATLNGNASTVTTNANLTGDITSVGNATSIASGAIVNDDINSAAGIVDTKLATISTANKVSLSALDIDGATDIGAPLADADLFVVDDGAVGTNRKATASRITEYVFSKVSGDIVISSGGTAVIPSGTIVNSEVSASAAIEGTKISPNFGSQNCVTTGNSTAAAFVPTGSTVPTNGAFLPAANTYGIATNGVQRSSVTADGGVTIAREAPNATGGASNYTILAADLRNGLLLANGGTTASLVVPAGSTIDTAFSGGYTNMTIEWVVINTGTGTATIVQSTNHTLFGNMSITTNTSGRFLSRRTSAGTYLTYRV